MFDASDNFFYQAVNLCEADNIGQTGNFVCVGGVRIHFFFDLADLVALFCF